MTILSVYKMVCLSQFGTESFQRLVSLPTSLQPWHYQPIYGPDGLVLHMCARRCQCSIDTALFHKSKTAAAGILYQAYAAQVTAMNESNYFRRCCPV